MAKILTFYLCDNLFGIDITKVKEINRHIEYCPVPGAGEEIIGLLNLRGQIVTLLHLPVLFGYEEAQTRIRSACIILKTVLNDPDYLGFVIDQPGDVFEYEEAQFEKLPANISSREAEFLSGVIKLKTGLVMLIDSAKLFALKNI